MSWHVSLVGGRDAVLDAAVKKLDDRVTAGYSARVIGAVQQAITELVDAFPDQSVQIETSGHIDEAGGSVQVSVRHVETV